MSATVINHDIKQFISQSLDHFMYRSIANVTSPSRYPQGQRKKDHPNYSAFHLPHHTNTVENNSIHHPEPPQDVRDCFKYNCPKGKTNSRP